MSVYTLDHNPELLGMVDLIPDIVFSRPEGEELALQLLKPRWSSGSKGFPLVLFTQGSGWTKPNQFWQLPQLSELARRGFVVASVTHRSTATAQAPAFLRDVKTALRYLRAHAAEYDIDQERVCAMGTSSGAHISMMMGLTANDPRYETEEWAGETTAVQAVVSVEGRINLAELMDIPQAQRRPHHQQLIGALDRAALEELSPVYLLKPDLALPPYLFVHGDADPGVPVAQSELLHQRMIRFRSEITANPVYCAGLHGFFK